MKWLLVINATKSFVKNYKDFELTGSTLYIMTICIHFRLVLVTNPLHYKRMVPKRMIHLSFAMMLSILILHHCVTYVFLRRDISDHEICITSNVVNSVGVYCILLVNFGLTSLVMIISYVIVLRKLHLRKRSMLNVCNKGNLRPQTTDLLTRAISITVGVYILLYSPAVICTPILSFVDSSELVVVFSFAMLLYYLNNVINPFIYYITLKDFREGYKKLLLCKAAGPNQSFQTKVAVVAS